MNRIGLAVLAGTFFAASAAAQSGAEAQAGGQTSNQTEVHATPQGAGASSSGAANAHGSAQAGTASTAIASGTTFNAALSAPVDSKKAKPGDPVTARTTEAAKSDGRTVLPKGTKLVGHVTRASARGKGEADSTLGIVFDKAVLKNGHEVPVNLAIQAIAEARGNTAATTSELDSGAAAEASAAGRGNSGGRVVNGVGGAAVGTVTHTAANVEGAAGGTVNSTANATSAIAGSSQGAVGGLNSAGRLSSDSRGVFGLNGLNLNSAVSNGTQGSVITSAGKNVHLDSGTRMLLVSETAAATPAMTTPKP